MKTETVIQRSILDWLKAAGILHMRVSLGGIRRGKGVRAKNPMTGYPDIQGLYGGRLFVVEVKTAKQNLSEEQESWRERLTKAGAIYILARSVKDVQQELMAAWEAL